MSEPASESGVEPARSAGRAQRGQAQSEHAIRPGTAEDWPAVARLFLGLFHQSFDENWTEREVFEPDRSLLVTDADQVVGHTTAFTRELSVPGGVLPAAHVSLVGVASTHRRRGLLTRLMRRQLAELPEPLAVLWASEGRIYPRFGYGMASQRVSMSIDTREVRLPEPAEPGRLRTAAPAEALPELRRVYAAVRGSRPGWSSRDERWWARRLDDPPEQRKGFAERRAVLHESAGGVDGVDGYALWRAKGDWGPGGPEGVVEVDEVVTTNPTAYLALWRFLLTIDLTRSAGLWLGAVDEPLLFLADEQRRLGAALGDGLFVRIVDLPAALTGRRYASAAEVVLEVNDPLLARNHGRWRLVTDGVKASCTLTTDPADLACDITDLGAAYLGGIPLVTLAAAGRVRELRPDTLLPASAAFGWHRAPAGIEVF